jgi:hypothetical protein
MKKTKQSIITTINCPQDEILVAIALIDKFKIKNDLCFDLEIIQDFSIDGMGLCFPFNQPKVSNPHKYNIYINPKNCEVVQDDSDFCNGNVKDLTIFGVTLHEFAHILSINIYKKFIPEYKKSFPTERFYLNDYSNHHIDDEIAEIITLYITNPFLLKIISVEHYKFCKRFFMSPISCSTAQCFRLYESFPIVCKEKLKNKFGIVYNEVNKKFEKIQLQNDNQK